MSDGYTIISLDQVGTQIEHSSTFIPLRRVLGFRAAGVNAWCADEGEPVVPPHTEDQGHEELYVVVRGRARFTVGEEEAEATPGTLVFVPPDDFRSAIAEEDGTIVLVVGGTVGQAFGNRFEESGWDAVTLAEEYRQAGRIDEAKATMAQLISDHPNDWPAHYNAGCTLALAGDADAAIEYLRRAKELDTEGVSAEVFREDSSLDSLRDDPRFQELLG